MSRRRPKRGSSGWKKSENRAALQFLIRNSTASRSRQNRSIFVWCGPQWGFVQVTRDVRPNYRWALIILGAAAVALSGCGRKGPLDLPPTASSQLPAQTAAVQSDTNAPPQPANPNLFAPNSGTGTLPTAGRGPKRPFALDPLLNSN
ncbi:MAG: lipoprotein [Bradyrhizobium sp.]|nr:lipoprotein [Bradyrhizobium sp.]